MLWSVLNVVNMMYCKCMQYALTEKARIVNCLFPVQLVWWMAFGLCVWHWVSQRTTGSLGWVARTEVHPHRTVPHVCGPRPKPRSMCEFYDIVLHYFCISAYYITVIICTIIDTVIWSLTLSYVFCLSILPLKLQWFNISGTVPRL